jgi:hypothetical protein
MMRARAAQARNTSNATGHWRKATARSDLEAPALNVLAYVSAPRFDLGPLSTLSANARLGRCWKQKKPDFESGFFVSIAAYRPSNLVVCEAIIHSSLVGITARVILESAVLIQ